MGNPERSVEYFEQQGREMPVEIAHGWTMGDLYDQLRNDNLLREGIGFNDFYTLYKTEKHSEYLREE